MYIGQKTLISFVCKICFTNFTNVVAFAIIYGNILGQYIMLCLYKCYLNKFLSIEDGALWDADPCHLTGLHIDHSKFQIFIGKYHYMITIVLDGKETRCGYSLLWSKVTTLVRSQIWRPPQFVVFKGHNTFKVTLFSIPGNYAP